MENKKRIRTIDIAPFIAEHGLNESEDAILIEIELDRGDEELHQCVYNQMQGVSAELKDHDPKVVWIHFLTEEKGSDSPNHEAEVIIDAIRTFFLEHHASLVENVCLIADNKSLKRALEEHIHKH